MKIISHRGYWKEESEKNAIIAFERSFNLGFGTETDIRDFNGELVISHDIPNKDCISVNLFLEIYKSIDKTLPLALNIKSDGLQSKLKELLNKHEVSNYFVFDMSIPDGLNYLNKGFNVYTRQSEYEPKPSYYEKAKGVWIDEFHEHWITKDTIAHHINNNKSVCIVSPDLHKRDYLKEWNNYKDYSKSGNFSNVMICTDYPETAKTFFHE
ncbi:hypothetical protein [Algibacter luteus]|uniref:Glycerophosphoryl diester phosphodiesterase n=1 Tax=Algibacter luteus TaxID=1178825 RepID=A0A1M6DB15_9FLAO|nr:hypothetical protein [Algibacter luteus]SHI70349.1 hypothetical protein SAMN05216261_1450 [Algibacter luteus]